jgi:hypothetical protein
MEWWVLWWTLQKKQTNRVHTSHRICHIHFNIIPSSAFRSSKFHYRLVFDHTSISISHFPYELHVQPIWFSLIWYLHFRPVNSIISETRSWVTSSSNQSLLVRDLGVPQPDYGIYCLLEGDAGSPVYRYRSFAGTHCLHLQSTSHWFVGNVPQHVRSQYTVTSYFAGIFFRKVKIKTVKLRWSCFRSFWIWIASRTSTLPPSVSRQSRQNVGASTSHNPMGLHGLLQG